MSFIYEKSPAWRRLVAATRSSGRAMAAFCALALALPLAAGALVQGATNPADDERLAALVRRRGGLDSEVLARANRERLGALLAEVRDHKAAGGEARYRAALDGRTVGTSSGSSAGVRSGHVEPGAGAGAGGDPDGGRVVVGGRVLRHVAPLR